MSGPLDLDGILSAFSEALAAGRSLGPNVWLAWRRWRAEWSGQVARLRWEADHYRELHGPGLSQRTLDQVLEDLKTATAMETLLDDAAQGIRWLSGRRKEHHGKGKTL